MFSRSRWMELSLMDLDTKATAVQHSPHHRLCKCPYSQCIWITYYLKSDHIFVLRVYQTSIKEEQEDEEISENYPYESPESTDEHGHSPEMNRDDNNGSPERPSLHLDRVPSLWLWSPTSQWQGCQCDFVLKKQTKKTTTSASST